MVGIVLVVCMCECVYGGGGISSRDKKVESRGDSMRREEEGEEMGQDTVEKQLIMSPIK